MPLVPSGRQVEIIKLVIARAEEQGEVDLRAAADEFGVKFDELREWVEAVVGLERRLGSDGGIIGDAHAYMNEDDVLTVQRRNWVRDMENVAPTPNEAVRLLIIATQYMSVMGLGSGAESLRSALRKIEEIVGTTYQSVRRTPPAFELIADTVNPGRRTRALNITYVNDSFEIRDRTIEPYDLYSIGGRWYVRARDPEETDPDAEVKSFRLDRISRCVNGSYLFDAPERESIPDSFGLSNPRRLIVKVPKAFLDAKPDGIVIGSQTRLPDGRFEVHLTVYGERRLDHVLVAIGPEAEIVAPEELRSRRAAHAAALLEHLG